MILIFILSWHDNILNISVVQLSAFTFEENVELKKNSKTSCVVSFVPDLTLPWDSAVLERASTQEHPPYLAACKPQNPRVLSAGDASHVTLILSRFSWVL